MDVFLVFVFLFGAIIGSFLNVVILRLNSGKSVLGRSGCFSCGAELRWFELVPIVSFFFLRGKCRHCGSRISAQYPIVEALTGFVFVFFFLRLPFDTSLFITLVLWSNLIVAFFYDIRHKIIPDACSLLFFLCASLLTALASLEGDSSVFWSHTLAATVLAGFFFSFWILSRGRWMGFGDVKLALGIGMYLGLAQGLSALAYAFWIGAAYSLTRIALERLTLRLGTKQLSSVSPELTMKSEVPFAPFLIVGTFLALWFASDLFHLNYFFSYA